MCKWYEVDKKYLKKLCFFSHRIMMSIYDTNKSNKKIIGRKNYKCKIIQDIVKCAKIKI